MMSRGLLPGTIRNEPEFREQRAQSFMQFVQVLSRFHRCDTAVEPTSCVQQRRVVETNSPAT
jgi:hypothetical protein